MIIDITESSTSCSAKVVNNDGNKIVCVCNEKNCDNFVFKWPKNSGQVKLVTSTRAGLRFDVKDGETLTTTTTTTSESNESDNNDADCPKADDNNSENKIMCHRHISVNLKQEKQSILGWGGAFTDSSGINIFSLNKGMDEKLIESYYGKHGLQYNFGRVPIGGSDFSARNYTYDDTLKNVPDYELKNWSLTKEDHEYKIKAILKAKQFVEGNDENNERVLKLFASPWSPPAWMKTSNSLVRGFLIDDDKIYKSYAEYLMKFFDSYKKEAGIEFWGSTIQNEPITAMLPNYFFNSLEFDNEQMVKFVGKYLGPALKALNKTKDNFNLMVGDDTVQALLHQAPAVLTDLEAEKYITGVALHWYGNNATNYKDITKVFNLVKDKIKFLFSTEACTGWRPTEKHVDFGSWQRGEEYANDIIEDLENWSSGWIDWNLALDMEGGPNWANNFVDSPILVDKSKNEFYKQPMYYALGHFSRFFKADSKVVTTKLDGTKALMNTIAVYKKDTNHVVVNILNSAATKRVIHLKLEGLPKGDNISVEEKKKLKFTIDGHSITSVIIKL